MKEVAEIIKELNGVDFTDKKEASRVLLREAAKLTSLSNTLFVDTKIDDLFKKINSDFHLEP